MFFSKALFGLNKAGHLIIVMAVFLTVLILSFSTWWISSQASAANRKAVTELSDIYLQTFARNRVNLINNIIIDEFKNLDRIISGTTPKDLDSIGSLRTHLTRVRDLCNIKTLALVDEDGNVYSSFDDQGSNLPSEVLKTDIREDKLYVQPIDNQPSKVYFIAPLKQTVFFEQKRLLFAVMQTAFEDMPHAETILEKNSSLCFTVFSQDGEQLTNTNSDLLEGSVNFFTIIENRKDLGADKAYMVKEDFKNLKVGTIFLNADGNNEYLYYSPIGNTGLMVAIVIHNRAMSEVVASATRKTVIKSDIQLIIVLAIVLILFLVLLTVTRKKFRVHAKYIKRTEQNKNAQLIAEQYEEMEALSRDYQSIYRASLDNNEIWEILLYTDTSEAIEHQKEKLKNFEKSRINFINTKVHPDDRKMMTEKTSAQAIREALSQDEEYSLSFRMLMENEVHFYQIKFVRMLSSIRHKDKGYQIIVGFRNVDELIAKEKERNEALKDALNRADMANKAKTNFLNSMSHDIRTPMNAIIGFSNLASEHIDNRQRLTSYLKKIQVSSSHLLSLINAVLDMSRIESGKIKIEEKPVHLPDLLHEIETIVQTDIKAKELNFEIVAKDVVNEDVLCDRMRLNRVLLNIVGNACKYTDRGGNITLKLVEKPCDDPSKSAFEFHIIDNGIGMSGDFVQRVFMPFEREQTTTVSGIQGSGLGMSIAKRIMELMGGDIKVESTQGQGSEFTVLVSFNKAQMLYKDLCIKELEGREALVIHREESTAKHLGNGLLSLKMSVSTVSDAKEAMTLAANKPFDLFVIDKSFKELDFESVINTLSKTSAGHKPMIVVTGSTPCDLPDTDYSGSVNGTLCEPLFTSDLKKMLADIFAKAPENQKDIKKEFSFKGKKILLVEDNELNREIAGEILTAEGIRLEMAYDGDIAVDIMSKAEPDKFDLILMDIQLPNMNGYEATRRIRALPNPKVAHIPIVAMTANAFDADRQLAVEAGMNGYIPKPINVDALKETLSNILRK